MNNRNELMKEVWRMNFPQKKPIIRFHTKHLQLLAKKLGINYNHINISDSEYNDEMKSLILKEYLRRKYQNTTVIKCYACKKEGHFVGMEECEKVGEDDECRKCHKKGHWENGCPEIRCQRCRYRGHKSDDCNAEKDICRKNINIPCHKCGDLGHTPKGCDALMEELLNLPATDI